VTRRDLRSDHVRDRALARETQTIPIVFVYVAGSIGSDFAPSLARPGGNITGFTYLEPTTGGKWVGLLKEIAPRTTHAALLFNPATTPPLKFYPAEDMLAQVANGELAKRDERQAQSPLCRCPHPYRRWTTAADQG
jgi:ABC transporter substrate binding protein